jgi:predicted NBD/HSP70 family sugar kinase
MPAERVTVRDLRRVHRGALLRRLILGGPVNRIALGEMTGLSSGAITNMVTEFIEEGLVVEAGTQESDGGRPRVQLEINPDFGVAVGVAIGETGIRIEGFDLGMSQVGRPVISTEPLTDAPQAAVDKMVAAVSRIRADLSPGQRLLGIGVAVPGQVTQAAGETVVHAPSIGWKGVPLAGPLAASLGVPVFVDNGAMTLGQAEMWFGAGRGSRNAVVALLGTGVGAAIFTDGGLYRGVSSSAGEWGHTCVVPGGRVCRCGARGCLETYVGAESLIEQWAASDPHVDIPGEYSEAEWINRLVEAAPRRASARQILDQTADYLGIAAANLVNLLNPERIVLGGWVGTAVVPSLLPRIRTVLDSQALDNPARDVTVLVGEVGNDAVTLGAASLVVADLLASGGKPRSSPESPPRRPLNRRRPL